VQCLAALVRARAGFDHELDSVEPAGLAADCLELRQVEQDQRGGRTGGVLGRGNDAGDRENARRVVDHELERGGRAEFGREFAADPKLRARPKAFQNSRVGSVGAAGGRGAGGALGEDTFARGLLAGEARQRDQVDAEQRKGRAAGPGTERLAGGAGSGGGGFDDGQDVDGTRPQRGAQFREDAFRQRAGGGLDDPVAAAGERIRKVVKAGDGGLVGEADGNIDGDAERENADEQRGLARRCRAWRSAKRREQQGNDGAPASWRDAAVAEVHALVADRGGLLAVGDEHEGGVRFVGQLAEQAEDVLATGGIEVAGRFIGENERGPVDEGAGDSDALLFAAGELAGQGGGAEAEADAFEQGGDAGFAFGGRDADELERQLDIFGGGERWQQVKELKPFRPVRAGGGRGHRCRVGRCGDR
jgi:hypothetical protein